MAKGQVQAISMVLIAGIVISLVGVAYFWGKPVIEKSSTRADISNAKQFIVQLDKNIVEVSRSGGVKALDVPRLAGSSLVIDEDNNQILFKFFTTQAMYEMGEDSAPVPVETTDQNIPGPYGGSPRIITLRGEPQPDGQYLMILNLTYRELRSNDPKRGYEVAAVDGGETPGAGSSGFMSVVASYASGPNPVITPRSDEDGGELTTTKVSISISRP